MRKYKSVEALRSSSDDVSDVGDGSTNNSLGSFKQIETEKKVKQKQLYLELKRKQERSRRKQPAQTTQAYTINEQPFQDNTLGQYVGQADVSMDQPPVIPPKPIKYRVNASQDTDSSASQAVNQTTSSLRKNHSRIRQGR